MAPASSRTDLAHPSIVRKAGRRSFMNNIEITPSARHTNPLAPRTFRLLTQGRDSESGGKLDFSTCSRCAGGGQSTDQNRRGGIDLHIETKPAERATLANELKFSNELKDRIGD